MEGTLRDELPGKCTDMNAVYRHSGMPLASSGPRALWLASMPLCSLTLRLREVDRVSRPMTEPQIGVLTPETIETTVANAMSTLVHHGLIFVPLGYSHTFPLQTNVEEVHGGTSIDDTIAYD